MSTADIKFDLAFRTLRAAVISKAQGDDTKLAEAAFDIAKRVLDDLHEVAVELRLIRKQNGSDGK